MSTDWEAVKTNHGHRILHAVVVSTNRHESTRDTDREAVIRLARADDYLFNHPTELQFVCNWCMSMLGYGGGI